GRVPIEPDPLTSVVVLGGFRFVPRIVLPRFGYEGLFRFVRPASAGQRRERRKRHNRPGLRWKARGLPPAGHRHEPPRAPAHARVVRANALGRSRLPPSPLLPDPHSSRRARIRERSDSRRDRATAPIEPASCLFRSATFPCRATPRNASVRYAARP